jgi:hypothetical protein
MEHCYVDLIKYQTKIRSDLKETPFLDEHKLFVDGSSSVVQGKQHNGYSVVNRDKLEVNESEKLPNNLSAQI